jgi:hypothetical protein
MGLFIYPHLKNIACSKNFIVVGRKDNPLVRLGGGLGYST